MYNATKYKSTSSNSGDQVYSLFQKNDLVIGTYEGGSVRFGTLIGKVDKFFNLDFIYQEIREDNRMITGKGFLQPLKKDPQLLNLFRTCSLRSKRNTRFLLRPI